MNDTIGLGRGAAIHWAPAVQWRQTLAAIPAHSQSRLSFMTEAHHRVRSFVVRELVRQARPLQPEWVRWSRAAAAAGGGHPGDAGAEAFFSWCVTHGDRWSGPSPSPLSPRPMSCASAPASACTALERRTRWRRPSCKDNC